MEYIGENRDNNYLITWFYAENKENESSYPSVWGGATSSIQFQNIYWKCVYVFFKTAYIVNEKKLKYIFFTNVSNIPTDVDGVNIYDFFKSINVEVITLELTNKTPKNWYGAWRNQFYLFDILEYLSNMKGNFLILDSDCIIRKPLDNLFELIQKNNIVTYNCGYSDTHDINGISIKQMKKLYFEIYNEAAKELSYKGGELIGISSEIIKVLLKEYKTIWNYNYKKYETGDIKLNEEAHFLSMIYYRLGYIDSLANEYIRRMWTAVKYDYIEKSDKYLAIWHLPAEKMYGFQKLFKWLSKKERNLQQYIKYSERLLVIPGNKIIRKCKKILWKIVFVQFWDIKKQIK